MKEETFNKELKNIAPHLLERQHMDDGLNIPDKYFETLEDRVFARIHAAGLAKQLPFQLLKKPAKRISMMQMLLAAAACICLIFGAIWFFKAPATLSAPVAAVELSEEDIESYLLENVQDLEEHELALIPVEAHIEQPTPNGEAPENAKDTLEDIRPEDVEDILREMTEEELENIL